VWTVRLTPIGRAGLWLCLCCQDHAVTAVGYGTDDASGMQYFKLKNRSVRATPTPPPLLTLDSPCRLYA
jgi:hypothetical protein